MFKSSRRKIVASIMSILVVLWAGSLGIIYSSSYFEMTKQNKRMLQAHAEMYSLPQFFDDSRPPNRPFPGGDFGSDPVFTQSPMFQLSTFYTVAVSYGGETLEIKNGPSAVHSNEDLEALALRIIGEEKNSGSENNLSFYKTDKNGYILVAFMDNTVVNENATMLFRYTLIFGGIALVLFFFLSVFLAKKIVSPLEESYHKQRQFISDAGHELKTPISVVSANTELLSRELGENQWLANIQYENERMGNLVKQLLDLARTENVQLSTEKLDLSRLVSGEALPFESIAYEKGHTLVCNIADNIHIDGNGTQLKQLVSILLDNAIRHSSDSGEITLNLSKEHGATELSVINRGNEIPLNQREQIFERFYRRDTVRNSESNHYGLGLAIAKAIATSHKGRISVYCYDGLVEFRVSLPIK